MGTWAWGHLGTAGSTGLCQEVPQGACGTSPPLTPFRHPAFSHHCPLPGSGEPGWSHLPQSPTSPMLPVTPFNQHLHTTTTTCVHRSRSTARPKMRDLKLLFPPALGQQLWSRAGRFPARSRDLGLFCTGLTCQKKPLSHQRWRCPCNTHQWGGTSSTCAPTALPAPLPDQQQCLLDGTCHGWPGAPGAEPLLQADLSAQAGGRSQPTQPQAAWLLAMGFTPSIIAQGLGGKGAFAISTCSSPAPYLARSLTQLAVVASVTRLTEAQELSNAVLASATIQAGLGPALVDLCRHLGRGEARQEVLAPSRGPPGRSTHGHMQGMTGVHVLGSPSHGCDHSPLRRCPRAQLFPGAPHHHTRGGHSRRLASGRHGGGCAG